ncbi:MAG TPA: glycosyltransferase family 4 protein [Solirubrobacteraceae bacterium]|nr:glycosyltransferase family 4 protein [Solirubrobacteraceae bacterium]
MNASRRGGQALSIALVAPVAAPVLPGEGESVEQLLSLLAEGLVARGHDVTLYATANSHTSARLRSTLARGYDEDDDLWDWYRAESFNAALAFEHAEEHSVIHAHDFHFSLPFAGLTPTPLIDTPHIELAPETIAAYARRPDVHIVAVSDYQRRGLGARRNVTVIPHGVRFDSFPAGEGSEGHLLFLGRMLADKGPAEAMRIARAAGMPLILAGPAQDGYDVRTEPGLDGERIRWVGQVGARERNRLLAGAVALLFPLTYPEPFGLVLLEAMACGTPVLATELGAAPEIVEPGVTGYTAAGWEELAELVPAAAALDRQRVRRVAAERFDVERMIEAHEALYRRIVESAG